MIGTNDVEVETIHGMEHLAKVLDQGWPEIAEWNRAIWSEGGETYRQLITRLRTR